ncbi:Hypothetical protein GLP15_4223 [Giardia lamblia P15]|uniref:Uncharacterized protein n=1 Tax=Giardia intestinalis (strain P15) TaxID=658858 RepID=E1F383_GIAIA|nr:Hypothetical protein GLP15_4223 [Giardia lamblia P15]
MADIAGYITEDLKCTSMLTDSLKNIALEARETVISQLATIRELEEEHQVSSAQLQKLMENIGTRSETATRMHKYLTELEEEDRQIAKLLSVIKYQVNTYYGHSYLLLNKRPFAVPRNVDRVSSVSLRNGCTVSLCVGDQQIL